MKPSPGAAVVVVNGQLPHERRERIAEHQLARSRAVGFGAQPREQQARQRGARRRAWSSVVKWCAWRLAVSVRPTPGTSMGISPTDTSAPRFGVSSAKRSGSRTRARWPRNVIAGDVRVHTDTRPSRESCETRPGGLLSFWSRGARSSFAGEGTDQSRVAIPANGPA